MKANEIWRSYGTDYKDMTKRLLEAADLAALLPPYPARIAVKPNLVSPSPAQFGSTTHPEVIAGIIEFLQERGYDDIVVAEGSWVGDKTSESFECCGYNALRERYGITLLDTQKEAPTEMTAPAAGSEPVNVCACVKDWDFLINVPVLKGHCQTRITCALKNLKGIIPNAEKRRFHRMGLHRPIALLNSCVKQDFIVVDHICGDLAFEDGGNPVTRNCVMAAADPVLTDAYVCELLGFQTDDVPYIKLAEELGCGSADLSALNLITLEGDPRDDLPGNTPPLDVSDAVEDVDSCSACYAQLIPAVSRLKEEGLLGCLPGKICIGQGHRGGNGAIGVGNCTRGFDFWIPGCPPESDDIYQALKELAEGD